jgi:MFS family permease
LLGSPLGKHTAGIPEANYRTVFILALIPGLLAVLVLGLGVKEKATPPDKKRALPSISLRTLKGPFGLYCLVATLFALGNSSNAFLLLRAQDPNGLKLNIGLIPAGYVLIYIGAAVFSTPAGILSDRLGRKRMLVLGYLVYALVYAGFAYASHPAAAWILFGAYGIYIAFTDGMQRALAADLSPREMLGTAMGTFNTLTGVALLPASLIAGALWHVAPKGTWPFWFGAMTGLLAAVLLAIAPLAREREKL